MGDDKIEALRRRRDGNATVVEVLVDGAWVPWPADRPEPLGLPAVPEWRDTSAALSGGSLLPFAPVSFRDFMLYEQHVIDASRAMARAYLPAAYRITSGYERLTGRTFPRFKPVRLWYEQPIYYMGNALTFMPSGTTVVAPDYASDLDYELELGFVINRPLLDATPEEAFAAVAGYVVLNDISARNVQYAEMRSGFGPQKAKHFASSMSAVLVAASTIADPTALSARVEINGTEVARSGTGGMQHSIGQALAHASRGERLYPGELFGTGTLPGCSGLENGHLPAPGDRIELTIDAIGTVVHDIAER